MVGGVRYFLRHFTCLLFICELLVATQLLGNPAESPFDDSLRAVKTVKLDPQIIHNLTSFLLFYPTPKNECSEKQSKPEGKM